MKAMLLSAIKPVAASPLALAELPVPSPGPGELLVKVAACGICRFCSARQTFSGVAGIEMRTPIASVIAFITAGGAPIAPPASERRAVGEVL